MEIDKEEEGFMSQTAELEKCKEQAKKLFQDKEYSRAHKAYDDCLKMCGFKTDIALIMSNMAQCCINLGKFEASLIHLHKALLIPHCDLNQTILIKLKYRLA
jgi:hypothetical protein